MKPIILIASLLAACGSSGGGSSQPPAADTATSTSTAATPTTKVADIVTALASVVLCKTLAQQDPKVQTLLASDIESVTTKPTSSGDGTETDYSPKGSTYSDGTDRIQWQVVVQNNVVKVSWYKVNALPAVGDSDHFATCP